MKKKMVLINKTFFDVQNSQNTAISLKAVKLVLYPQVRISMTQLTLLKVSRSRNKIVEPHISQKTNERICLLGESVALQFCFEIY